MWPVSNFPGSQSVGNLCKKMEYAVKDFANEMEKRAPIATDVGTIITGVAEVATLNPAGIIAGVTTAGVGVAKLIGHLNPETFDQTKVDGAEPTITGNVAKGVVTVTGGDAELAGEIGNAVEGGALLINGLVNTVTKGSSSAVELIDLTVGALNVVTGTPALKATKPEENVENVVEQHYRTGTLY